MLLNIYAADIKADTDKNIGGIRVYIYNLTIQTFLQLIAFANKFEPRSGLTKGPS